MGYGRLICSGDNHNQDQIKVEDGKKSNNRRSAKKCSKD